MELTLHRTKLGSKATEGTLEVDGTYECVTLEDVVRDLGPDGLVKYRMTLQFQRVDTRLLST